MTESNAPKTEQELRELLKKEAMLARPDFSPDLHERFRNAIRTSLPGERDGAPQYLKNTRENRLHRRLRSFAAAGAACVIIASAGVFWWNRTTSAPRISAAAPNPVAAFTDVAGRASLDAALAADDALAANQWGRLDEDAKTAAKMLLENLPLDMLVKKHNGPLAE